MSLIMALLLIDCIIVSSWAAFDPMKRDLRNLTLQIDPDDRSVVYQPQVKCKLKFLYAIINISVYNAHKRTSQEINQITCCHFNHTSHKSTEDCYLALI